MSFILTMRNVNLKESDRRDLINAGFILTMRNVNYSAITGATTGLAVLY